MEKEKFFALYLGQKVFNDGGGEYLYPLTHSFLDNVQPEQHLLLRCISQLTDDECKEVARLSGIDKPLIENYANGCWIRDKEDCKIDIKIVGYDFSHTVEVYDSGSDAFEIDLPMSAALSDYLRSIGILIPFMSMSVQEILDRGWAKIKED